jgi:hypothetical protein
VVEPDQSGKPTGCSVKPSVSTQPGLARSSAYWWGDTASAHEYGPTTTATRPVLRSLGTRAGTAMANSPPRWASFSSQRHLGCTTCTATPVGLGARRAGMTTTVERLQTAVPGHQEEMQTRLSRAARRFLGRQPRRSCARSTAAGSPPSTGTSTYGFRIARTRSVRNVTPCSFTALPLGGLGGGCPPAAAGQGYSRHA